MDLKENIVLKLIVQIVSFMVLTVILVLNFVYIDDYSRPMKGVVSSYPYPFSIKSQVNLQIQKLYVDEGRVVEKGDVLIRLDDESLKIELGKLESRRDLLLEKIKWSEEKEKLHSSSLKLNEQYKAILIEKRDLSLSFLQNKKELSELSRTYTASMDKDAKQLIQVLSKNEDVLISKIRELDIKTKAHGAIERTLSLVQEEAQIDYENKLATFTYEQNIYEITQDNTNLKYEINQARQQQIDLRSSLADVESDIKKLTVSLKHTTIIAPENGVITSIAPQVLSSNSIRNHEELLTLVPKGANMFGVVQLSDEEYRQVKIGQQVNLEFYAWNHYKYGVIRGRIERVSVGKKVHPYTGKYGHFAEVAFDSKKDVQIGYSFKAKVLWQKVKLYKYILKKLNVDKESKENRGL